MIVIPGPASGSLGEKIADEIDIEAHPVEHRVFPDGESYVRITVPVEGETVVLVQTTSSPQDTHLLQLLLMAGTAKDMGAKRVICVVPYLAYSRQDKRFLSGEAVSLSVIMRTLEALGAGELIVVDAHNKESIESARRVIRVWNLSAIPLLAKYLKELGFDGAYSLAPDVGAIHLAESAARILGGGSGSFEKRRDRRTGQIEMDERDLEVEGRDVAIFDDIVSSGGTMARAVAGLKRQGASRVAAACTHALFMGDAERRIREAGADIIVASDTVETQFSKVSVAPLIAECLRTIR